MTSLVAVGLFYSPWNSAKVHRMLGNPFRWLKSRGTIFWCNQSQEGASFVAVHLMGHFPPLYRQRFCNDTQNRNITFTGVRATFWNSLILCSKHGLGPRMLLKYSFYYWNNFPNISRNATSWNLGTAMRQIVKKIGIEILKPSWAPVWISSAANNSNTGKLITVAETKNSFCLIFCPFEKQLIMCLGSKSLL